MDLRQEKNVDALMKFKISRQKKMKGLIHVKSTQQLEKEKEDAINAAANKPIDRTEELELVKAMNKMILSNKRKGSGMAMERTKKRIQKYSKKRTRASKNKVF